MDARRMHDELSALKHHFSGETRLLEARIAAFKQRGLPSLDDLQLMVNAAGDIDADLRAAIDKAADIASREVCLGLTATNHGHLHALQVSTPLLLVASSLVLRASYACSFVVLVVRVRVRCRRTSSRSSACGTASPTSWPTASSGAPTTSSPSTQRRSRRMVRCRPPAGPLVCQVLSPPTLRSLACSSRRAVMERWNSSYRLMKHFGDTYPGAAAAAKQLRMLTDDFKRNVPLIRCLASKALAERHWVAISEKAGRDIFPAESDVTLKDLLDAGLLAIFDDIEGECRVGARSLRFILCSRAHPGPLPALPASSPLLQTSPLPRRRSSASRRRWTP